MESVDYTGSRDLQQKADANRQNQEAMAATLQSVSDQQCRTIKEVGELLTTLCLDCGSNASCKGASSDIHNSFSTTTPMATCLPHIEFPLFNGDTLHKWLYRCTQFFGDR
ncbi:hypothetical protein KSP40_PGU006255 [Platanthera guangdongensis]|uniref:Uncharacterized protein n=1 Tax=Platanthera guangdongensis TaxID=2320717 RepID=A0ABR2M7I8_9ASPA